jgi:hypothetical protein
MPSVAKKPPATMEYSSMISIAAQARSASSSQPYGRPARESDAPLTAAALRHQFCQGAAEPVARADHQGEPPMESIVRRRGNQGGTSTEIRSHAHCAASATGKPKSLRLGESAVSSGNAGATRVGIIYRPTTPASGAGFRAGIAQRTPPRKDRISAA